MADSTLPPPDHPILASGEKFATQEAQRHTTVDVEASLPEGGAPAEATVTVGTAGSTRWFDWGASAWFRRKFQRGGSSAGVKGEIKF